MSFHSTRVSEISDKRSSEMSVLISQLLYKDTRRSISLLRKFTLEDPSSHEMATGKRLNTFVRVRTSKKQKVLHLLQDKAHKMSPDEWNFFYAFTTIQFLLSLDFMSVLEPADRIILIENFAIKASFLFKSLRSIKEKSDKLITPDGEDVVPSHLVK